MLAPNTPRRLDAKIKVRLWTHEILLVLARELVCLCVALQKKSVLQHLNTWKVQYNGCLNRKLILGCKRGAKICCFLEMYKMILGSYQSAAFGPLREN